MFVALQEMKRNMMFSWVIVCGFGGLVAWCILAGCKHWTNLSARQQRIKELTGDNCMPNEELREQFRTSEDLNYFGE